MKQFYVYIHYKPNGDPFYVGKGHDTSKGRRSHSFTRRDNQHKNIVAYYGISNIKVEIYYQVDEATALAKEVQLIKAFREAGYPLTNRTDGGEGLSGYTMTAETKAKIAAAHRGMKHTQATKDKLSAQRMGVPTGRVVPLTADSIARIRAAHVGNKYRVGKKHTPETLAKMSKALKGKKRTAEQRAELSRIHKERWAKRKANTKGITAPFGQTLFIEEIT